MTQPMGATDSTISAASRSRAARGASLLVYLLAALGMLRAVFFTGVIWTGDGSMHPGPLPQLHVDGSGFEVSEYLEALPRSVILLSTLPMLVVAGVGLAGAWLLAGVLARISRGEAFTALTRLGLARLSLVLILGSVTSFLLDLLVVVLIERELDDAVVPHGQYTVVGPSFPVFLMTLGIVTAALLFAFRDGAALEREADGVV